MSFGRIKIYKKDFVLQNEFRSSGSVVKNKTTYYYVDEFTRRIVEIPYSPSMDIKRDELVTLHPFVLKNISWLNADLNEISLVKQPQKFLFKTYGIGQSLDLCAQDFIKIKCDADGLGWLADKSEILAQNNMPWIADFNQSLTERQLLEFLKMANLTTCFGLEQPFPRGKMTSSICKEVPIILDEEMIHLDFVQLKTIAPKAVVLKPWRYSFLEYIQWHNFLIEQEIPYMVGSMIQSEVADHLCDELNLKATFQYKAKINPINFRTVLSGAVLIGELELP